MIRSIRWFAASALVSLVAGPAYCPEAEAQVAVIAGPPAPYIASYEPIYYNGFAHYWYRDRWYYRDHGAWRGYEREPAFLHDHRAEWARHRHGWR
jgi:hypothetical protein